MNGRIRKDMMVPQLQEDGTFVMIQVKKDSVYTLKREVAGSVLITTSNIILPTQFVLTEP